MIDTISTTIYTNSTDHIIEHIDNKSFTSTEDSVPKVEGTFDIFRVTVIPDRQIMLSGSMPKYYYGDNFQTLTRERIQFAFSKIADALQINLDDSKVHRFDLATNVLLTHQVSEYLPILSGLKRHHTLDYSSSSQTKYFQNTSRNIRLYDKLEELKNKNVPINPMFLNTNILRYEVAFKKAAREFKRDISIPDLYSEAFYSEALNKWKEYYDKIAKVYKLSVYSSANISCVKDLYKLGIANLLANTDGTTELINNIEISGLKRHMKRRLKNVLHTTDYPFTEKDLSSHALELNERINSALEYFR